MTTNAKPTLENPLKGDVWVHGRHWAVTALGMEATNGTCEIPVAFLGAETLMNAAAVMPRDQLQEFASIFATALLMHGRTVVSKDLAHAFFATHLAPAKH